MNKIAVKKGDYSFGTVAIKHPTEGFITTTRGKREDGIAWVKKVDHQSRTIFANTKATLNAPFLAALFERIHGTKYIIHGHRQLQRVFTYPYAFSGTTEETKLIEEKYASTPGEIFNVQNHGYYACFCNENDMKEWLDENY